MRHGQDPFIVLFMRWRIADNAALAAERRLHEGAGEYARERAFLARQLRAVACHQYGLLVRHLREARARLPLL